MAEKIVECMASKTFGKGKSRRFERHKSDTYSGLEKADMLGANPSLSK